MYMYNTRSRHRQGTTSRQVMSDRESLRLKLLGKFNAFTTQPAVAVQKLLKKDRRVPSRVQQLR